MIFISNPRRGGLLCMYENAMIFVLGNKSDLEAERYIENDLA
jgi:GTPase SAR1 family protein